MLAGQKANRRKTEATTEALLTTEVPHITEAHQAIVRRHITAHPAVQEAHPADSAAVVEAAVEDVEDNIAEKIICTVGIKI